MNFQGELLDTGANMTTKSVKPFRLYDRKCKALLHTLEKKTTHFGKEK